MEWILSRNLSKLAFRGFLVWLMIIAAEIAHGMLRAATLVPMVGEVRSNQIGVFTGSAIILTIAFFTIRWIEAKRFSDLMIVGVIWLVLTVTFEILFGKFVVGRSWDRIASEYNLLNGGLMPLGLGMLLLSPWIATIIRDKTKRTQEKDSMKEALNMTSLRSGLTVKLWAMWVLLGMVLLPLAIPTELGLFIAIFVPLSLDFVGRCLCAVQKTRPWSIRLSIAAQFLGIGCLIAFFLSIPGGVFAGAILAAVLQAASAKLFVAYLQAISQVLGRQDLSAKLDTLRSNVFRTTLAFYGVGLISLVVILAAVVFGILAYVVGLMITLPVAFVLLLPLWMTCMVLYFLMLYSYQSALVEFRWALTPNA